MRLPHPAPRPTIRRGALVAVALLLGAFVPIPAAAAEPTSDTQADQVVVRYRADTTSTERWSILRDQGLTALRTSTNGRTQVVVGAGRSPATVRRLLAADPNVLAVGSNSWRELQDDITDEPYFAEQWGIHNSGQETNGIVGVRDIDIDGLEALRLERGSPDVVVAVIDDGVDFTHPDLAGRRWVNPGELPDNDVDDDHNGYVDDVFGWDFCADDALPAPTGADSHGTHVAGTIAASLDGTGVVGVAPGVSVLAIKAFSNRRACSTGDALLIDAIDYAASFDVPIINASWGGPERGAALEAAIGESNALVVAASGNEGSNMDAGGQKFYPAASTLSNVLSVGAVTERGGVATFSNVGKVSVDILAPGRNILSTLVGGYGWASGTSMAAPHVSGIAALALSALGTPLTPTQLKKRVLDAGTPLAAAVGKTVTGRLANAWRAVDVIGPVAMPVDRYSISAGTVLGTSSVATTVSWPAATDQSGVLSYRLLRRLGSGAWSNLTTATTASSFKTALAFGTLTSFRVLGRDQAGNQGGAADGPFVTAALRQDATSLATYTGSWSTVNARAASGGRLHASSKAGASVQFTTTARTIAVVARRAPTNGQARVYVDGDLVGTIDLRSNSTQARVVVFSRSWTTSASRTVRLVVVGTAGRPRVEIDAFIAVR